MIHRTFVIQTTVFVALIHILLLYIASVSGRLRLEITTTSHQENVVLITQLDSADSGGGVGEDVPEILGFIDSPPKDVSTPKNKTTLKVSNQVQPEPTVSVKPNQQKIVNKPIIKEPKEKIITTPTTNKVEHSLPESKTTPSSDKTNDVSKSSQSAQKNMADISKSIGEGKESGSASSRGGNSESKGVGGNNNGTGSGGNSKGKGSANTSIKMKNIPRSVKSTEKGKVKIVVVVGNKNNLLSVHASGGTSELAGKAERLAKKGTYISAKQNGEAIQSTANFIISFD